MARRLLGQNFLKVQRIQCLQRNTSMLAGVTEEEVRQQLRMDIMARMMRKSTAQGRMYAQSSKDFVLHWTRHEIVFHGMRFSVRRQLMSHLTRYSRSAGLENA